MKFLRQPAALVPLALFALLLLSVSCGGGGAVSGPPPPPPPPPQPLQISSPSLPNALVADTYNQRLQATGGTPPLTWSLGSGEFFVNGLTLSSDGLLSGVLTLAGGWCPTFWVKDAVFPPQQNSKTLCLTVFDRLAISTSSLPSGLITREYDQNLQLFGGASPYTWSVEAGGSIPPGLTLESSGRLHGTPTTPGSFSFTVQLKDSSAQAATKAYTVAVYDGPLVTTNPSLPIYISGQSYSLTFQATAGVPPYVWDSPPLNPYGSPNNLPTGFTLTSDGVFSGSNNNYGFWGFFVRVTDSLGRTDVFNCALIMVQPLSLPSRTLPGGNVGIQYSQQLSWIGGFGPYSWGLASGSGPIPPGIALQPFGYLIGTPTTPGNYDFTVELSDSINEVVTQSYSILIKNDVIIVGLWSFPYGIVSRSYLSPALTAVGGTPPYTWSATNGTLPPGLITDGTSGQISGTPTLDGTFAFDIQASDSSNPPQASTQRMSILIRPPLRILSTTLPDAAVNSSYSGSIQAEGGSLPPYHSRITSGSLPAGINLGTTGDSYGYVYLSGFPSASGVSNFTVEISDSSTPPATVARDFSIRTDPQLRIDQGTSSFPDILEGQSFTYTFTATGGFLPYIWSTRFAPAGMVVDSASGVFSGAPTQRLLGGVFADVQDSANPPQHASQLFFWRVLELLRIRTSQFPPVAVSMPVRMYPSLTGESCCTYNWSIVSGALPTGLSVTDPINGEISGTPTTPGTFNFTLQVKDIGTGSLAQTVSKSLSMVVAPQGQLGRNDSIAAATPLSNGIFRASISPADDGSGALNPDNDYYAITANPGVVVTIESNADHRTFPNTMIDTVIEILDIAGNRHSTCNTFSGPTYPLPCMNDDQYSGNTDSKLYFQVPGAPGDPPVTFYVRVLDWSGMARPDFFYLISISGAN